MEPAGSPAKVLLLLGSLDGGGAERVAVTLLNHFDPARARITIGLLRRTGAYLCETPPGRIVATQPRGPGLRGIMRAPDDIAGLIEAERPDILMSFGMGVNMLARLALWRVRGRKPRWICREDSNTDAEIDNLTTKPVARGLIRWAIARVYRSADRLLAVSRDLGARLERQAPGARLAVIHNPIDIAMIRRRASEPLPEARVRPYIVAAGRMVRQKGYDILISAFAGSVGAWGVDLVILGAGPLEGYLRRQAEALGVADRVIFAGFQENPWAWFARARLFVLASRWEGFANVIAEAMACGAPALATDCDFGPREQITHGVGGWLVAPEDAAALTRGLDTLLADDSLRLRIACAGEARAQAFDIPRVVAAYAALFAELLPDAG
jgi:glycosyltransferase involved in cell wall biosynthesis